MVDRTGVSCVVTDVAEKLSDAKTQTAAAEALTALSEATKLEYVATQVLEYAFSQKNPKVQVEVFNWLGSAVQDFGLVFVFVQTFFLIFCSFRTLKPNCYVLSSFLFFSPHIFVVLGKILKSGFINNTL